MGSGYPLFVPVVTIDLSSIRMSTGSDEEMTFHTFRGYLEAVCVWATALHPHPDGMVSGVAQSVKAKPWRSDPPSGKVLSARAGEVLRNAWATEVC